MFFPAIITIWAVGLDFWIENFTYVSIIQHSGSLIGGLGLANIGLVWTRLWAPSATIHTYLAYSLWPAYLGLVLGATLTSTGPYGCMC
jgi:hypothetical protein